MYLIVSPAADRPYEYPIAHRSDFDGDALQDYRDNPGAWKQVGLVNIAGRLEYLRAPLSVWRAMLASEPLASGNCVDERELNETENDYLVCSQTRTIGFIGLQRGSGRATYHPAYDTLRPWVTYINGTAGLHFATDKEAVAYFRGRGFEIDAGRMRKQIEELAAEARVRGTDNEKEAQGLAFEVGRYALFLGEGMPEDFSSSRLLADAFERGRRDASAGDDLGPQCARRPRIS